MIRFTTIYDLYQREEDAAKTEVGRCLQRLSELQQQKAAIERARLAAGTDIAPELREQYVAFWRGEETRLSHLALAIRNQEQALTQARAKLSEAHRRVTTIGKLRDRDRVAARKLDERREQRRSDDRAALAHWER